MPERKVRTLFARYKDSNGQIYTIPRGEVHNFPQSYVDKWEKEGVFFDSVDDDPQPPGYLIDPTTGRPTLDSSASDEELVNWLTSATVPEALNLVAAAESDEDAEFAARIDKALEQLVDTRVTARTSRANQILDVKRGMSVNAEGLTTINPATEAIGGTVHPETVKNPGAAANDPNALVAEDDGVDLDEDTESTPDGGLDTDVDQDPAEVVRYTVRIVSDYLSKHPEDAQEILEAENARVANTGEDARRGVVRAVQAVAGHTE